jgi:hypothetical protein
MKKPRRFELNPLYFCGRKARDEGQAKVPPATVTWRNRHWWLAGWNDRDMEVAG